MSTLDSPSFEVRLTSEAKGLFAKLASEQRYTKPGLMVHRQGAIGDVVRSDDGKAVWNVERPHPWKVRVGEFEAIPETDEDVVVIDGVRIWLPLIPRPGEQGVGISVRGGELVADAIVGST
jgi:hypothetical protein